MKELTKNRNALILFVDTLIDQFGSGFTRIALLIYVTQNFNLSALSISSIMLMAPGILFSVPIGFIIDKTRKHKFILFVVEVTSAISLLLASLSAYLNRRNYLFFVFIFIVIILSQFMDPMMNKIIVNNFSEKMYSAINSLLSSSSTFADIFSATIATLIAQVIGINWLFLIDAGSYVVCGLLVLCLKIKDNIPERTNEMSNSVKKGGIVIKIRNFLGIKKNGLLGVAILAIIFNVFLSSYNVYIAEVSKAVFQTSSFVGFLDALFSVGFFVGAAFYTVFTKKGTTNSRIAWACLMVAFSYLLICFNQITSIIAVIMLGIAIPTFNITVKTKIQTTVPAKILASFYTSYATIMNISSIFGLVLVPATISQIGLQETFLLISSLCFVTVCIFMIIQKKHLKGGDFYDSQ